MEKIAEDRFHPSTVLSRAWLQKSLKDAGAICEHSAQVSEPIATNDLLNTRLLSKVVHLGVGDAAWLPPLANDGTEEASMRVHEEDGDVDRNARPSMC